jgi:ribonuclease D
LPVQLSGRYIDRADEADALLSELSDSRRVALDTEGASFHRFLDRVYLLQLSTDETDVIIDPLAAGPLPGLTHLLANPEIEIVLHDADYDLRLLRQDYGARIARLFDTRVAAQLLGIRSYGLAALLEQYFGVVLEKKYQRADWSLRPLPAAMLEYAVLDTHHLLPLRDRLAEQLESTRRWSWAAEEFLRIETENAARESEAVAPAFLRIKGARDLTRRELAVLRELAKWRDELARKLDRALFRVAGNDILLEIARQRPRSIAELSLIRIVPRSVIERYGSDVIEAIAAGEREREQDLPRFPRPQRWDRDAGFDDRVAALRQRRDDAAARLDMDPGVLCSRDRLESIARARPRSVEELAKVPGVRRWQAETLGSDLLRAL